jgi:hypothetical protein
MRIRKMLVLAAASVAIVVGASVTTGLMLGVATDAAGSRPPATPGAQSTTAPIPAGGNCTPCTPVSLALPAGEYVATWDIPGEFSNGFCMWEPSTNVTSTFSGNLSALVTVGRGGGTLTIGCSTNDTGNSALLTATPTTIH